MITDKQTIEEILAEADAYGKREEVIKGAKRVMAYFIDFEEVEAYQYAFKLAIPD